MRIAGLVKTSTVDYPGELSAVVFTAGCNYDCFYCHNRHLLGFEPPAVDENEVFAFLERRAGQLDALVVTGGEPTLQPDLGEFLRRVKALGYLVKLDTNGSNPATVASLVREGLVDRVALDYKAPFARYRELTGGNPAPVLETMRMLALSGVAYEVRTTVFPQLSSDDLMTMAGAVPILPSYALQAYRAPEEFRPEDVTRVNAEPHGRACLAEMGERVRGLQPATVVRQ